MSQAADRGLISLHPTAGYPLINGAMQLLPEYHPRSMQQKLHGISKTVWGYDNFGYREGIEVKVKQMYDRLREADNKDDSTYIQRGFSPRGAEDDMGKQEILLKWTQSVAALYLS